MTALVISQVFPPRTGGSGRWLWELYRRLTTLHVHVVAGHAEGEEEFDRQAPLSIERTELDFPNWGLLHPGGLPDHARALRQVAGAATRVGADALHCGKCLPEGLIAASVQALHGVPFVVYAHGEELLLARTSRELRVLTGYVLRRAARVIANSHHTRELLVRDWKLPAGKVSVVHPGVDSSRFVPAEASQAAKRRLGWDGRRVVLTTGALQKRKGQDMMIRALPAIGAACPDVLYVMIGQPLERPYLEALVDELEVQEFVQFRQAASDAELIECYQQCDLFALPSRRIDWDIEGFGIVAIEAQACGKPAIVGCAGGAPETVEPTRTGEVVDCSMPGPLAAAVIELLQDSGRRAKMGAQARAWAARFDWDVVRRSASTVFEEMHAPVAGESFMKGLILTYIVTYVGAVVSLRYPLIGVYIYVSFAILRPQEIFGFAGDLSSISSIIGYALLVGWTFRRFGTWRLGAARTSIWLLFAFLAFLGVSALLALDTSRAFPAVVSYSKLILPFLAGVSLLNNEKDWRTLAWVVVLSQGYVGFEQNLNYAYKGFNTASEGFGGMDNNFFGLSLVTTLGPAIALTLACRSWTTRALAGSAAALILHTILLTYSRGAMVGMLAVGFVAFVLMPKRPANLAALMIVALLVARLTGPQLMARYGTTFVAAEDRDGSAESRVDLWRDCLLVIQEYPFFGVGPANWRTISSRYGWAEGKSAHSVWMETAAEVGVPGALALFAFFAFTASKLLPLARARITEENRFATYAAQGVVLGTTGFIVSGQFVSAPALEVPYYVLLVGIALMKNRPAPQAVVETATPQLAWTPLLPGAGATTLRPPSSAALTVRR